MSSLIKALRRSSLKHKKLGDDWGGDESREVVFEGVTFFVKYIGSSLVEEAKGQTSTALAIKTIVLMAKSKPTRKLDRVSVTVSPRGVRVVNPLTQSTLLDVPIYRISYCSADACYDHVFAFVAANRNDTFDCHAFLCPKKKVAQAVTLTIAQAFQLAFESWQNGVDLAQRRLEGRGGGDDNDVDSRRHHHHPLTGIVDTTTTNTSTAVIQTTQMQLLIDFDDDNNVSNVSSGHHRPWVDFDCDISFQKFIETRFEQVCGRNTNLSPNSMMSDDLNEYKRRDSEGGGGLSAKGGGGVVNGHLEDDELDYDLLEL